MLTSENVAGDITSDLRLVDPASSHSDETSNLIHDLTQILGHLDVAEDGHLHYFGAPSYFNLLRRSQYPATSTDDNTYTANVEIEYHETTSGLPTKIQNVLLDFFWTWRNP